MKNCTEKKSKSSITLSAWVTRGTDVKYIRNGVTHIRKDWPLLTLIKPTKCEEEKCWHIINFDTIELPIESFPEVKWEDEEPTRVKITIEIL